MHISNSSLRLLKAVYPLEAVRAAILSISINTSCQIEAEGDYWIVVVKDAKESIENSELLRRIDEFVLRKKLEERFASERDAIFSLAFGKD